MHAPHPPPLTELSPAWERGYMQCSRSKQRMLAKHGAWTPNLWEEMGLRLVTAMQKGMKFGGTGRQWGKEKKK